MNHSNNVTPGTSTINLAFPELGKPPEFMGIHFKVLQSGGIFGYLVWMIFEHLLAAVSSAFLITVLLHTALKRDPHLFRLLRAVRHLRRGGSAFYRHPSGGSLKRVVFRRRADPVS